MISVTRLKNLRILAGYVFGKLPQNKRSSISYKIYPLKTRLNLKYFTCPVARGKVNMRHLGILPNLGSILVQNFGPLPLYHQ